MARVKNAATAVVQEEKKVPKGELVSEEAARIADSRRSLEAPLPEGMAFFESPEGYIVVAEATRPDVWCNKANNGKGMRINPKR